MVRATLTCGSEESSKKPNVMTRLFLSLGRLVGRWLKTWTHFGDLRARTQSTGRWCGAVERTIIGSSFTGLEREREGLFRPS